MLNRNAESRVHSRAPLEAMKHLPTTVHLPAETLSSFPAIFHCSCLYALLTYRIDMRGSAVAVPWQCRGTVTGFTLAEKKKNRFLKGKPPGFFLANAIMRTCSLDLWFLDASMHLYKRLCPLVRPSVGASVGHKVLFSLEMRQYDQKRVNTCLTH